MIFLNNDTNINNNINKNSNTIKLLITLILLFSIIISNYINVFATDTSSSASTDSIEDAQIIFPSIISEAAIIIDSSTNRVLYEKNMDEKMYPASTTKILTAIITIENCDLNEVVTASSTAVSSIPSRIFFCIYSNR